MADFLALCRLRSECTRRAGAKNPEKSLPLLKRERADTAKIEVNVVMHDTHIASSAY